ncbi:MAG: hypothetical protein BWK76_27505 [Desulfobulbaceae bacterium A2]|nr:MAG: hypothetical protein BWK76_27505 [Desulfobulbaceae bacterium A2]
MFLNWIYNLLQCLVLTLLAPAWLLLALRPKYRGRISGRLGLGLPALQHRAAEHPLLWIHALSLGEVSSAAPLIAELRRALPQARLILTTTTSSGHRFAQERLSGILDHILPAPFDFFWTVRRFHHCLRPDLFILVETDFWPNWLRELARRQVPLVLVNGRISARSWQRYQRLACFFRPLFRHFSLLCTQTAEDAERFAAMGLDAEKIAVLGNLKYASLKHRLVPPLERSALGFSPEAPLWICGSTHPGEETILFQVYQRLRRDFPKLELLLAPRNPGRGAEIATLAAAAGLACRRRSDPRNQQGPILLLDTLGELAACYGCATVAFIGGSLVAAGGHNPLEAAAHGVPLLHGPHMEDFQEIARDLTQAGAARTVRNADELTSAMTTLLTDAAARHRMAAAATGLVARHEAVVERHLARILPLCRPCRSSG